MKKFVISGFVLVSVLFQFCTGTKKAASPKPEPVVSYTRDIAPIVAVSCAPCHIPGQGNKKPYDTYSSVKMDIDNILTRIQKNPGERGFMPARKEKLSDEQIQMFIKWKESGFAD